MKEMHFSRLFSLNLFKNRSISLGEMTFTSDFVNTTEGDLYPVLEQCAPVEEAAGNGVYTFRGGSMTRFFARHFPYATYTLQLEQLQGAAGVRVGDATVFLDEAMQLHLQQPGVEQTVATGVEFVPGMALVLTFRVKEVDAYIKTGGRWQYITAFELAGFENMDRQKVFTKTPAALYVAGAVTVTSLTSCLDCGVCQADIRPICYEDGTVMVEQGKIYLTMTCRMEKYCYQGVFSWVPGTCRLDMTGAIFYDAGDDMWANDVAASIKYHRPTGKWLLWMCSFARGHILGHGSMTGDPRFGLNVADITLMEKGEDSSQFLGFFGDEDPDIIFDGEKWRMAICRRDYKIGAYRYFIFESDDPFVGYRYVGRTAGKEETGGYLRFLDGKLCLICGAEFNEKSQYHVYDLDDLSQFSLLHFDYPDGGFRGWGGVMDIPMGSRVRRFHLTFDRYRGGDYTWSYGNLYCFEEVSL